MTGSISSWPEEKLKVLAAHIDKQEITEIISAWSYARDQQQWEQFRACFHEGATISVSFYSGAIEGFIKRVAKMGASKHVMANTRIELKEDRAVTETNVLLSSRGAEKEIDLSAWLRFVDLFEKREGSWRIVKRVAIYEKDRIDPVIPSGLMRLFYPRQKLESYPREAKHLFYELEQLGFPCSEDHIVTSNSEKEKRMRQENTAWLSRQDMNPHPLE
ncbi:MAG: hypothetical protein GKR87_07670 [Kiritimatiellae bacterium]|nr:hypothetical protein [Kiritimatiellia bacterium]